MLLLILAALSLSAQSVVSISPSGDRPSIGSPRQLDGFGLEPLLQVQFAAPIDPNLYRERIYIEFGPTRQTDGFTTYPDGYRMPISHLAWEESTNTLFAKPDDSLDHDRDYRIVVTNGVDIIASTRFHTQNVTRELLDRRLGPAASLRKVEAQIIDLTTLRSIESLHQVAVDPTAALINAGFPVDPAFLVTLGLRRLVLLDFESPSGDRIHVHAWLPNAPKPVTGWPVKLIGHGLGDSRFSGPTLFASAFIGNSVVMAIDAVGHGYGPNSRLRFTRIDGSVLELPTGGRGQDLNRDGRIEPGEGCIVVTPENPDFTATCLRETALDYRKLVREIQYNIDLDGDQQPDLDPNSIQFLGQSLGAMYGTILTAIEPGIDAAVLNVGGGTAVEISRTNAQLSALAGQYLRLLNPRLEGVRDPLPARFAAAQRLTPGEAAYLIALDRLATIEAWGAPASFAPFLKQATLFGSPIKRVLFQYALGDRTVANNANGQLIRAAHEYELVSLYRHDLARAAFPGLPENPHAYMAAFAQLDQPSLLIALATLSQASEFLASGRREVPDVNGLVRLFFRQNLFEVPSVIP